MKEFFKQVGATVVGIMIFCLVVGVMSVMSIVGMIASSSATKDVADNTVFVIDLNGQLQERAEDDIMTVLSGGRTDVIGLDDLLLAIKKAKNIQPVKAAVAAGGGIAETGHKTKVILKDGLQSSGIDKEVYIAVISMALKQYLDDVHDNESNIITIKPHSTMWNAHIEEKHF